MANILNLALRGLQLFFAILILGLSGHLVASQVYGGAPSITNYEVFLGIWLFIVTLIGIAASFIDKLGGIIMLALDVLSILFTFAGGVGMATKLGAHSCTRASYVENNVVTNGGKNRQGQVARGLNRANRCREAQADTAFIWFAFATFCVTAAFSFMSWRRGGVK